MISSTATCCGHGRIALIEPPVSDVRWPSLALGILSSVFREAGRSTSCFHLNLDFANEIEVSTNQEIVSLHHVFAGDFIFSDALRHWTDDEIATYINNAVSRTKYRPKSDVEKVLWHANDIRRNVVPRFLDSIRGFDWTQFCLIGITTTFQQQAAAVSIAKAIKSNRASPKIVVGGANVHEEMGVAWLDSTPVFDFVCLGEGEPTILELLRAIEGEIELSDVPNLAYRGNQHCEQIPKRVKAQLNETPTPAFDEYFDQIASLRAKAPEFLGRTVVPVETSRGCWWGEKHHCVFCGLNGAAMNFRSKTAEKVLTEIESLSRKHKCLKFQAVDNILDMKYFSTLLPRLQSQDEDYEFFFEIKSNLKEKQVESLVQAGIAEVQPGIESFDDRSLAVMDKGVSGIQNVCLLKWSNIHGLRLSWNFLIGFANETEQSISDQLMLFPLLFHLEPPGGYGRLLLERFSPMFTRPSEFGVTEVKPNAIYANIFREASCDVSRTSYFFDYRPETPLPSEVDSHVQRVVKEWRERHDSGAMLTCKRGADFLEVFDSRDGRESCFHLDGLDARLYLEMDRVPRTLPYVLGCVKDANTESIELSLKRLIALKLVVHLSGRFFGLATVKK